MSDHRSQGTTDLASNQRLAQDIAEQLVKEGLIDGSQRAAVLYRRPVPFAEPPEPALAELFDAWSLDSSPGRRA